MKNIIINFEPVNAIKRIIIKPDNLTLYFSSYDELLTLMDITLKMEKDSNNPFTYVINHYPDENPKEHYHDDIDPTYTDEGHYHFEKKSKTKFTENDLKSFFQYLFENNLLTDVEINCALVTYRAATCIANTNKFSKTPILGENSKEQKSVVRDNLPETLQSKKLNHM